jgi:nicotinate phosphoribosyltransferase
VRKIFDAAGLKDIKIVGSGGLDEYDLLDFSEAEAPFDSYGVGTRMGVSADAPWLDIAYKLVEHGSRPVLKLSPGKVSWPGKKQVYRQLDGQGRAQRDVIALRDERLPGMEPLLKKVMECGKVLPPQLTLDDARKTFIGEFKRLADPIKAIRNPASYPVEFTPALKSLLEHTERKINGRDRWGG